MAEGFSALSVVLVKFCKWNFNKRYQRDLVPTTDISGTLVGIWTGFELASCGGYLSLERIWIYRSCALVAFIHDLWCVVFLHIYLIPASISSSLSFVKLITYDRFTIFTVHNIMIVWLQTDTMQWLQLQTREREQSSYIGTLIYAD